MSISPNSMLLSGRTRSSNDPQPLVIVLSIQNNLEIFGIVSLTSSASSKKRIRVGGAVVLFLFVFPTIRCETCFDVFCHLFNAAPQVVYNCVSLFCFNAESEPRWNDRNVNWRHHHEVVIPTVVCYVKAFF